ncbi:DNA-binding protein [Staphylococcus epidermidis 41tr]|nr:DNA-binding protein [Staphylococcus epidermidis 41tr]
MEHFNLGSFLRRKREEKGLTTRDLGKKIGYSYSYIAGVEKGHKVNPSVAFLENYIYAISKNIHEISQIKEEISKGTKGKYYPDFLNVKKKFSARNRKQSKYDKSYTKRKFTKCNVL